MVEDIYHCYGLNDISSKKSYVDALTPAPQNVASFGDRALAGRIGEAEVRQEWAGSLVHCDQCPVRRETLHLDTETQGEGHVQ